MKNEVKLPIETIKDGNKTTKICVEDVYKLLNRIGDSLEKNYQESRKIIDSIHKTYKGFEGELIIGKGVSQPCIKDAYDEEIGSNIAFMKAKLNANLKKARIIEKLSKSLENYIHVLGKEYNELLDNIIRDVKGIRLYNPDFRQDLDI